MQVLFDHVGCLKKYETAEDILREFYELRMRYYGLRKDWLTGLLGAESAKLSNQARFILEKIKGVIVIGKPLFSARNISEQGFFCWKQLEKGIILPFRPDVQTP